MIVTLLLVGSVLTQGVCLAATRASRGLRRRWWVVSSFVAMGVSVTLMAQAIARGVTLAVGYGIWSGAGIVLAAAAGMAFFGDRVARTHVLGLALVLLGVVAVYAGG